MFKQIEKNNSGITLVALIVTIIILLILASISIGTITGDNSIIQNAIQAKEQSEINNEKEQLEIASTQAKAKDKYGDLRKPGLIAQLDTIRNQMPTNVTGDGILYVEYTNTHRFYEVEADGDIDYVGDIEGAKSRVRIKASPEKNTKPELVQDVALTITTVLEYENDELTIHYGWTTDETAEPTKYESLPLLETEKTSKRNIDVSSSEIGSEGNYYLWVKVKILETGKETVQKFGPYAVKENTRLIVALDGQSTGPGAETYYLNGNLKRNQIKKITISDSLQGHTPTEDKVCWDVSTTQTGKILAWYEPIEGTDYYAVTIAQNGGVIANNNSKYLFKYIGYQDLESEWTPTVIEGLKNLDTSKVTNMFGMFSNVNTLQEVDLSVFNTTKVTDSNYGMYDMFNGCTNLQSLDLKSFDTHAVKVMYNMFSGCESLTSLDLRNFDTHSVKLMNSMFSGCKKLKEIKWDTNKFVTDNVTSLGGMFSNCSKLESIDVSKWNTSKNKSLFNTFRECSKLTNLDTSNWTTPELDTLSCAFYNCTSLESINTSNWTLGKVTTMYNSFYKCSSLNSLNVTNWNPCNVTDMRRTFFGCSSLENLDVSNWDTTKLTMPDQMFSGCSALKSLDLSKWKTANLTDVSNLFSGCTSLTNIDVSNFGTSSGTDKIANLTSLNSMFLNCKSLTNIVLTNFRTDNATSFANMFSGCSSLTSLDLSNLNTQNLESIYHMFNNCTSLTNLTLNFDTSKVTNVSGLFRECKSLQTVNMTNFDVSSIDKTNSNFSYTFLKVPTTVQIITNESTKTWLNTNFPSYTNIVVPTN